MPRASIIISSFNYAPYLRQAIDSALAQTETDTQVIVVDDGSSDESPSIIRSYGQRIVPVFKPNGGQASALNAGFERSSGQVVLFVDSDDALLPHAVRDASAELGEGIAKVHWKMLEFGTSGKQTGRLVPAGSDIHLARGDIRAELLAHGPRSMTHVWPPTSGNAFAREYLQQVMPIPQARYVTCPDIYLCGLAPLYGRIARIDEPLSMWRLHASNNSHRQQFERRIDSYIRLWDDCCQDVAAHARRLGFAADPEKWIGESWWRRIAHAIEDLRRVLPAAQPFVLVDGDQWACSALDDRPAMPLFERDGQSQGCPGDDPSALAELDRQHRRGARAVAFAWPAFWWLDHYPRLARRLRDHCTCLLENDRLVVFDLEGYSRG
jgi:glycosyltransferase involved in cell wall biosynthesis